VREGTASVEDPVARHETEVSEYVSTTQADQCGEIDGIDDVLGRLGGHSPEN
jgi:hypothetical protein